NVLVSADGRALLTDFGLSTLIDKLEFEETTASGIRAFTTIRFAAPELLNDKAQSAAGRKRSKTPASDVYAFAMLVIQAFTGDHPWPEHSISGVVCNVAAGKAHRRPQIEDLSDLWWEVCTVCAASDPALRPSMKYVHNILEV
ncbi:kinase-like protein, partial [Auricularia subglabra TFB-10046 SS5]